MTQILSERVSGVAMGLWSSASCAPIGSNADKMPKAKPNNPNSDKPAPKI